MVLEGEGRRGGKEGGIFLACFSPCLTRHHWHLCQAGRSEVEGSLAVRALWTCTWGRFHLRINISTGTFQSVSVDAQDGLWEARPYFKSRVWGFAPSHMMHLNAFIKVPSGQFVLSHRCWPWIFTACLSGDNNDCLRPSSCQTSVLRDFACLTQVTLIFGSSVASLRQGICCTHGDHMAFAAARKHNLPQAKRCTRSPTLLLRQDVLCGFTMC